MSRTLVLLILLLCGCTEGVQGYCKTGVDCPIPTDACDTIARQCVQFCDKNRISCRESYICGDENKCIPDKRIIPEGSIVAFGAQKAPEGWLLCDGMAYSRKGWPALFKVIGTTFGFSKDGVDGDFKVPDLRGRVPVGVVGESKVLSRSPANLGQPGGAETHTVSAGESGLPSHAHGIADPGHTHGSASGQQFVVHSSGQGEYSAVIGGGHVFNDNPGTAASNTGITGTQASPPQGAVAPHNNMQPYLIINYIIKY